MRESRREREVDRGSGTESDVRYRGGENDW